MFSSLKPPNLVEGIDAWQCAVLANYIFFYFLVKLLISAEKLKGIKKTFQVRVLLQNPPFSRVTLGESFNGFRFYSETHFKICSLKNVTVSHYY